MGRPRSIHDLHNPNRDLSDPNWISSEAYHIEMKNKMRKYKANRNEFDEED